MQEEQRLVKLLTGELVYGNTGEILDYCKKHDTNVKEEYTHITPSIVSKQFKYIGYKIHQPYAISRSINY
jgi:hypothetical protein